MRDDTGKVDQEEIPNLILDLFHIFFLFKKKKRQIAWVTVI